MEVPGPQRDSIVGQTLDAARSSPGISSDEVITDDHVGVLVQGFTREAYLHACQAAESLLHDGDLANRCLASARNRFDLETVGGARYRRLYRRLLEREAPRLVTPP